ncbi:MAG: SLBB domain-containing protein [Fibrobacteria bacterium]|nr:SLBB domain-containing protein [Fibrobacteria bacterium]
MKQFYFISLILLVFSSVCLFAGLEDKALEMRALKEQGMLNLSARQIDSLKNAEGMADQQSQSKFYQHSSSKRTSKLDSLIQKPLELDSLQLAQDSNLTDSLPKRYSQQIFARSPGSLFGSDYSAVGRSHTLGPGDGIVVSLWGDKEKEYNVSLNNAGKIFLEGIGLVSLDGLSVEAAEKKLKAKLSRIYSGIQQGTAHVEISQVNAGPIRVFVLGEVITPGGYIFGNNTSIFSAMYQAKGPTDIGTVRNMKLTRANDTLRVDLYDYLLKGIALSPNNLQDGDVLFASRAYALVEIEGDVGRPAIYELKKGEGIKELIEFAGHLNPSAATHPVTLSRIFENGKTDFIDLATPQDFLHGKAKFELKDGDKVKIAASSERSEEFITVAGPVKYEGTYQKEGINTVSDLVEKAGGLHEEAYLGRVHILRFNPDGSSELFSHTLEETSLKAIELKGKDNVILYSTKDMLIPDSVEIAGAVFNPGKYLYSKGMTMKGLILRSGGYLPEYEVGRAICFRPKVRERKVESIVVNLKDGLGNSGDEFQLEARDFILVPTDPNWYQKEVITLAGQFKYPGRYTLLYPDEKLASVVKRAGGLKTNAYVPGFRFFRKINNIGRVGIDLGKALDNDNSSYNITMLAGDSVYIPEQQTTVKVLGEVGLPTSVLYKKGESVKYYIDKAGGFTRKSDKGRVIVEYANGETTKSGMFMKDPDPGSIIFIPDKPEPKPINWLEGINAILATVTAGAALLISILAISNQI